MMDTPPTQVFEDSDFTPTQKLPHPSQHEAAQEEIQIGVLSIGADTYVIKKGINKIGRHPDCNIILNDQTVSKNHAEIEANSRETSAWICDLNSSNKTKLNNSSLRPGRCYELKDGSSVEFGMVHAIYKIHRSMDGSMIPETPVPNRRKEQQTFIPGTPDSSLNNSSTLEENISMIPGTQAGDGDAVFRRPSIPQRTSTNSSRKSFIQDSSTEDSSMDDSRSFTARGKENVGGPKVSIHDMETQKSFESHSETEVDIHDVETQKICLASIRDLGKTLPNQQADIHDLETQHEEDVETQDISTDIHDVDTQNDEDIHEMKTPKKSSTENVSTGKDDSITDVERRETGGRKLTANEENDINNCEQNASEKAARDGDATINTEQTEIVQRGSQDSIQLSLTKNFEDESELDRSRNLLGSQYLFEDFMEDDDPLDETKPKSSTSVGSSQSKETNETREKSSDEENIFDAATQIGANDENIFEAATQRIAHPLKASVIDEDSDDTDQEGVFQRYSRKESQDSAGPSKSQLLESEDSDTDEEGRFTEIALKEKRASCSFEVRQNESKEAKNDAGSSKDSDDLFDTLTQHINQKNKDPTAKEDKADVDYDVPTQVITMKKPEADARPEKDTVLLDVDDLAPTQILPSVSSTERNEPSVNSTKNKVAPSEENEDITEMEDNTATQIVSFSEKVSDADDKESPKSFDLIPNPVEECTVEDIDYEMAPTQLLGEVERKKPPSTAGQNSKNPSRKSHKVNLNDTLEKNLNEMFDDVNDEHLEDQSQISTQVLTNMLQSSQCEDASKDKPNDDSGSPEISKAKKLTKGRRSKPPTDSVPHSTPKKKSCRSNLKTTANVDSENTEQYFSALTSPRKRNILVDSQDSATPIEIVSDNKEAEELATVSETVDTTNKRNSVPRTVFKSSPKGSSTPRSLRRNEEKSKSSEPILEEKDLSKNDKNVLEESSEKVADKECDTSIGTIPHQQISVTFEHDDEDILAGLPEVRISGTLSNPASPTVPRSTENKTTTGKNQSKQGPKKAVPRKRAPRKPTPKSLARINVENTEPYRTISKPDSSAILASFGSFDVEKVKVKAKSLTVHDSDDEKINGASKQPVKKSSGRLRKSQGGKSLAHEKSIPFVDMREQASRSPSIQSNGRTRNSSKESVDRSSVFQVGKEAPVANAEPAKRTVSNASRVGKRSLSSIDPIESSNAKKRKEDVNGDAPAPTKGRRSNTRSTIVNRSNSANILDYMTKRSSPLNVDSSNNAQLPLSQSSLLPKQLVIKVARVLSSTPTESTTKGIVSNETKRNRRSNVNSPTALNSLTRKESVEVVQDLGTRRNMSQRASSKGSVEVVQDLGTRRNTSQRASSKESVEVVQDLGTRRNTSQRVSSKRQCKTEDISSQIGEESQEVEMIMNASLKVRAIRLEVEKKKDVSEDTRTTRARNTRKRANTNAYSDIDLTETSASSDLYDSDNARFEAPALKVKRTKITKNASSIADATVNEPTARAKRNSKQPSRSTRGHHQSLMDSSVEESAEVSGNETPANNTASRVKVPRKSGRKPKATGKKQEEDFIEDSNSGMNSSIDNASVLSTPTRVRRSMSSSFSASSPLKVKHRVLFTGISNNDYSKMLTKLGASQVEDPTKCSVLVTDKVRRTVKFLCALAQSVPIVSVDWLVDSEKAGRFVELENYILKDPVAEAKFGFKLRGSLEKARKQKLLEGYTIVLTPKVAPPPLPELKSIIGSCGGKPLVRPPTLWPQKAVIISREEDLANAKKFLAKAPKTVTIQSTEFILTGILRQELNLIKYKLT